MCFRPPQVQKPIKCLECGALNPFNRTTCKKCGAELPPPEVQMVICPQCGAENLPDSDGCAECGLTAAEWMKAVAESQANAPVAAPTSAAAAVPSAPKAPAAPMPPSPPKAPVA